MRPDARRDAAGGRRDGGGAGGACGAELKGGIVAAGNAKSAVEELMGDEWRVAPRPLAIRSRAAAAAAAEDHEEEEEEEEEGVFGP